MPFSNPIVGGQFLVIPSIESAGYVAGSSGWRIARDGSVEFNSGTFRGSVEIGNPSGQHAILANAATGDPVDVYNTANKLVFSIDATGRLSAISAVSTAEIVMNGANLLFEDTSFTPQGVMFINGTQTADLTMLNIQGGMPQDAVSGSTAPFIALTTSDAKASEWINTGQRGVQGAMVQTDNNNNSGQIIHTGFYTATVSGTGGMATFNHNCGFTPIGGVIAPCGHFSQYNWDTPFGTNGFTATQAQATFFQPTGAALSSGSVPNFFALFWG